MIGKNTRWNLPRYDIPHMNQIRYQLSVRYRNLVPLWTLTIVIMAILPLTLTFIITSSLLSLSRLNRCGLLILVLHLVLKRRLLILGSNNVWIRIIRHRNHRSLIMRMDICRYNTCLTFLLLQKATMWFLSHSLLRNSNCDFSKFNPIVDPFSDSHNICKIG